VAIASTAVGVAKVVLRAFGIILTKTMKSISLICPHDHHVLAEQSSQLSCASCGRQYQIVEGVVCTLERPDHFYEEAYKNQTRYLPHSEKPWHVWPLWLINSGYVWMVRRVVPKGATVVELGCAGGVRYFGERYRMIGCDLSHASLKILDFYERRVQADAARCIALPDGSVDAVVSSYFWEHIRPGIKPKILTECQRILKPGGKLVFLYDVETENPLIRMFKKKDPELYRKLFIEGDGHVGYQTPDENLKLYEQAGLRLVTHLGFEKTFFQSPSAYEKLAKFDSPVRLPLKYAARLARRPFFYFYAAFVRFLDTWVCAWLPSRWARIAMVVCEKVDHNKAPIK
jgi:SAM-dependent methyltransferase